MHSAERERVILEYLDRQGFVSFAELERRVEASPATIRRDLERLTSAGLITRVRGGARRADGVKTPASSGASDLMRPRLVGVPFHENIHRNRPQKEAIGRAAAKLCTAGEAVMIDVGSMALQMCYHMAVLHMQVSTNFLHIVNALLIQSVTRVVVPAVQLFCEQNHCVSADSANVMPRF